jgi:ribosome-associated protein
VIAAQAADDKRARDIDILDLRGLTIMTDYFVLASAETAVQVRAITEGIAEALTAHEVSYARREGWDDARWVLLDYGDVVVHVFLQSEREYYDLERLWGDAPRLTVDKAGGLAANTAGP